MTGQRLRFGAFIAPHTPPDEHPALAIEEDMDGVVYMEKLGYDEAWTGEHHSGGFGCFLTMDHHWANRAQTHRSYELIARFAIPKSNQLNRNRIESETWLRENNAQFKGEMTAAVRARMEAHARLKGGDKLSPDLVEHVKAREVASQAGTGRTRLSFPLEESYMHIGVFTFNTEYTLRTDRLARAAEERGFESLWVPEHTHIPVPGPGEPAEPETGMPLSPADFYLPEEYRHMSDPFTALAAAAAVTTTLRLGTCVCLINQHHPINLAKQVATVDQLSDGRMILGIGAGWNVAEMGHHGVAFKTRWRELRERLEAVRCLWREDRASFDGEFVSFGECWQYPKPVQPGGPPVVLGTMDTEFGREQVARYGDGWLPLTFDVEQTRRSLADIHARMKALGRDPAALEVSLFFLADEIQTAEAIARARDTGATRMIMRLPVSDEASVLKALDGYARYL